MNTTDNEQEILAQYQTSDNRHWWKIDMRSNKFFLLSLFAVLIWGFQPLLLDQHILKISDVNPAFFIFFRYTSASIFFYAIYLFLSVVCLKRKKMTNQINVEKVPIWTFAFMGFLMGIFMYLSRFLEILSYGMDGSHEYATFGMIFSIFFVILWDWKGWVIGIVFGTSSKSLFISLLAKPLPRLSEVLSWIIQSTLVLCAGLFFVYAEIGRLPSDVGAMKSIFWALGSSFFLSCFYDVAIKPMFGKSPIYYAKNLSFVFLIASVSTLIVAFLHWGAFTDNPLNSASGVIVGVLELPTQSMLKYFLGYVLGITCVAYFLEAFGLSLHDAKNIRKIKIPGRDWASIFATLDPFVGVLVAWLFLASTDTVSPGYYILSAALVLCVGIQASLGLGNKMLLENTTVSQRKPIFESSLKQRWQSVENS